MIHITRTVVRTLGALAAAAAFVACNSTKSPAPAPSTAYLTVCDLPAVCQDIVFACHSKDDGTAGMVHDCHLTGHVVGTVAACTPKHDACVAACNTAPALSDGPVEDLVAECDAGQKA